MTNTKKKAIKFFGLGRKGRWWTKGANVLMPFGRPCDLVRDDSDNSLTWYSHFISNKREIYLPKYFGEKLIWIEDV